MTNHIKLIILVVLGVGLSRTAEAQIERRDFLIPGGAGRLHVREVRAQPLQIVSIIGPILSSRTGQGRRRQGERPFCMYTEPELRRPGMARPLHADHSAVI